jgi:hypothetical protein
MSESFMESEVRVFCQECKDGKNAIWHGTLIDWRIELSKSKPPEWAHYAKRHEKAHAHTIMIKYPDGKIVPWIALREMEK